MIRLSAFALQTCRGYLVQAIARRAAHGVCLLLWALRRAVGNDQGAPRTRALGLGAGLTLWLAGLLGMGQTSPGLDGKPILVKEPARREKVSYSREIAELLEDKCTGCHGTVLAEKGLSLESVAGMLKGGKRGPAIVRGKADSSLMFKMAAHRIMPVMPPKDKPANKPMTSLELGLLQRWINEGAIDDSDKEELRNEAPRSIELGELPPGVHPINAVDMTPNGARVVAGRANLVQVYDVDSGLEIVSLGGHKDLIQSVRFSPDSRLLAAGSYQIVTVWTAPEGNLLKELAGHVGSVLSVAIASDGKTAFSGGQDKTIRAWNLADGKLLRTFTGPAPVTAIAIVPGGQSVLTGASDGTVRWLDALDGRERMSRRWHTGAVLDLAAFIGSPPTTMRALSVAADGTARVGTVTSKDAVETPPLVLAGHKGAVRSSVITSDGQTIVTGGDDGTVRFWRAHDGKPQGSPIVTGHTGSILSVAASADGKSILTGSADKTARLFAHSDGKLLRAFAHQNGRVRSVAFSPSGDRIATGDERGGLKVWETTTGLGVIAFGHTAPGGASVQPLQKVVFSGQDALVSASADGTLKTWRFTGSWMLHKALGSHVFRILALDFSPDGGLLAAGGGEPSRSGEVKIWEVGKGMLGRSLPALHSDTVFALRFSPDGTKLATASADKFLKVSSVADGKLMRSYEGHTHHVLAVDWRSDGKELVSGGGDNVLKVWDYPSGEQLRTLQAAGKQVTSVRWIAGKPEVVGASGDTQVRIWNPENGGIARGFGGSRDYVYSVTASADGSRIAAGGADGVLFVWNGQNGQVLQKLEPTAAMATSATAR
jgi:WD40 repeat protein